MYDGFCLLGANANALSLHRIHINKDLGIQFYDCWIFFLCVCIDSFIVLVMEHRGWYELVRHSIAELLSRLKTFFLIFSL